MSMKESKRKRASRTMMKALREDLFRWFCEKDATNSTLNRHTLREGALELAGKRGLNGFKCSEVWLTHFLREYGFSNDLSKDNGPVFSNYREWIDLMRSMIIKYRHKDLFHADELTMYSDALPTRIASNQIDGRQEDELPRNRTTVLMCCNSTGTTKLPLVICGPYPSRITTKGHVYSPSEDSTIGNDLFRNWLTDLNDRMTRCNRRILLFLRRNRARALRGLEFSNVNLVFLPEDFPPLLRPLRRDVFHYVKMIFRRRYVECLRQRSSEWNLRNILESLIEAWDGVPREIIVSGFQRTHFRTDDCFLQLDCDCWDSLETGISFKRFVTFDDDLSEVHQPSSGKNRHRHGYNLRASCRDIVQINEDNSATNQKDETMETSRDSSLESHRDYRVDPKDRIEEKLDKNKDDSRQYWLAKDAIKGEGDRRRSKKTGYYENRCSIMGQRSDGRATRAGIIKNVFAKGSELCPMRSVTGYTFKQEKLQREIGNADSVQAIIDKALISTSTPKANYARKLIDRVFASNEQARRAANDQTRSEGSNVVGAEDSKSTNEEPARSQTENAETAFISLPSTSGNDRGGFSENPEDHGSTTNSSDENNAFQDDEEASKCFKKKRRSNESNPDEPMIKKLTVDCYWTQQFETTFVFGSTSISDSTNRFPHLQTDENIADSCRSSSRLQHRKSEAGDAEETCIFNLRPSVSPKD